VKVFRIKEKNDKEYAERLFKKRKWHNEELKLYEEQNDVISAQRESLQNEFSGVTGRLRDISNDILYRKKAVPILERTYDARAPPFEMFENHILNQYSFV